MTFSQIFHQAVNRLTRKVWFPKPELPQKLFQPSQAGPQTVTAFTTGFSQLDKAIEIRGLPQGRITELIGSEGQGRIG